MLVYQVTITLDAAREAEWLDWMRRVHLPDVLSTDCFTHCGMTKAIEPSSTEVTYVIRYNSPSLDVYERYRMEFALALQQAHTARFAGAFRGTRLVLKEVFSLEHAP